MKLDTQEMISQVTNKGLAIAEEMGIDIAEDEFSLIQQFDDGEAIIVNVVEDDEGRTIKVNVNDTTIILPKIDGSLDIFASSDEEEE